MGKLTKNQKLAAEKIEAGKAYSLKEAAQLVKMCIRDRFIISPFSAFKVTHSLLKMCYASRILADWLNKNIFPFTHSFDN